MVVLSEYGSLELDLTRGQAEAIQRTGYLDVSPVGESKWRITATSYVGSLVVDGIDVLVRPKINPVNLFLLLEPGLPPRAWRQEAFDYATSSNLLPSVIAFFARTVETTLGRGVLRSYRARTEPLLALRGRLDSPGQFKRAGVLTPISCRYDDFTEDTAENRVLRAAIRLSLRVPRVDAADRQRLMRQLVALEGVADVSARPESVDMIAINRLNQYYEPVLRLARLLLANLTLTDTTGSATASSFMVDMNDLFQRFVTERLRRELRGRLIVIDEPSEHLGTGGQVSMRPDLVFHELHGAPAYVGDVKYKLVADAQGQGSDFYQLLAYTTAMNLPEGVLIYCRRAGDTAERAVIVRNSGKRLIVRGVDLAGSPEEVESEVADLADAIVRASTAARPGPQ